MKIKLDSFRVKYRPKIRNTINPAFWFQFNYGTTGFAEGEIDFNSYFFQCSDVDSDRVWRTDYAVFDSEKGGMDNWNTMMSIAIRRWLYEQKQEHKRVNFGFEGVKRYYDRYSVFEFMRSPWWWSKVSEREVPHGGFEDGVDYYGKYVSGHLYVEDMMGKKVMVMEDWFIPKEEKHSYGIPI